MPYIPETERKGIDKLLNEVLENIIDNNINTHGKLNYMISKIIHTFVEKQGMNYQNLNNVIGMLECVKAEYYRRIVSPYEDIKKNENGEVFERK